MIGHKNTLTQIKIAFSAAKARNMALPHMLFSGHPGCGKTTMAKYIAEMCATDFISVIPETLNNNKNLVDLLNKLNYENYNNKGDRIGQIKPTIIFLDEVHNLPMYGQEKLGIVMENFTLESGQPNKFYWVPYFTVIGATTLAGELSRPFLNRFKRNFYFEPYSYNDSIEIVLLHAEKLKISITKEAATAIANRGRGVPRIIVGYLEICRDTALAYNSAVITNEICEICFNSSGIDSNGFSKVELKILKTLYNSDKPLGLDTLSIITNESVKTIKNELEQYLIQQELMVRSGSGRTITAQGRRYLEEQGYVGVNNGRVQIPASYQRL